MTPFAQSQDSWQPETGRRHSFYLIRFQPAYRLSLLVLAFFLPGHALADVIWLHGQPAPRFGQIESVGPDFFEFRPFKNGRLGVVESIPKTSIEQFVDNIDQVRLSNLNPSQPSQFRDYAEELASQAKDPVARSLARRLFLIAAAQSYPNSLSLKQQSDIQLSALEGILKLAESETERKQIQRLRYTLAPNGSEVELKKKTANPVRLSTKQREQILGLVRAIRKEDRTQILAMLNLLQDDDLKSAFKLLDELCSPEELERIASVIRPNKSQLGKLLRLEIALMDDHLGGQQPGSSNPMGSSSAGSKLKRRKSWGDFATAPSSELGPVPSFENLTQFDPEKSIYRDDSWIRPDH